MNDYYLKEFEYFNGIDFIKFNITDLNVVFNKITVAVTNCGRISIIDYELLEDNKGYYFEYGQDYTKIYINDFE